MRENDWTNPRSSSSSQNLLEVHWLPLSVCTMSPSSGFSLLTALSRVSITRFSLMRGHLPSDYLAREQVEVGSQAGPSFPRGDVGDVAAPYAVPLLDGEFPVQDTGSFVRGLSAPSVLPGPPQDTSPFLAIMRCTVLPFATMPILRSSTTICLGPSLRLFA